METRGWSLLRPQFVTIVLLFLSNEKVWGVTSFTGGGAMRKPNCVNTPVKGGELHLTTRRDSTTSACGIVPNESMTQNFDQFRIRKRGRVSQRLARSKAARFAAADGSENNRGDQDDEEVTGSDEISVRGGGEKTLGIWPCGDELDKNLIKIALPCIANFAINPLIGAVDLFWINRMGNPLAIAGQAAANQIFSAAFWLTSFLPSVTCILVAKEKAKGNEEGVQDVVCQALFVGFILSMLWSAFILTNTEKVLGIVLKASAPAREFATPYLLIRGFAFLPSIVSLIGFSAFRGVLDTTTPLKISLLANLINVVLDPILIFKMNMGVTGAALATLAAEVVSALLFTILLFKRRLIKTSKLFRLPSWRTLVPLLQGGAALQLRNFALNLTFISVTRVTQSIDDTGVAAAAHALAIQTFQLGGVVLLALSTVAQTIIPNSMTEQADEKTGKKSGGIRAAKAAANRLMSWGFLLGSLLGALQVLLLPYMRKATPIEAVCDAARAPAILGSVYQIFNGMVFIGEGIMIGCGNFMQLSLSTLVATSATLLALREFPKHYGLTGVWMSFGVFNTLRLLGVFLHQTRNAPIASRNIKEIEDGLKAKE
eukprot:CAMPEP_0194136928 /NCGR_PEP_ID=MMETSP0152-20130528/6862_1 /TAXON_ID=1049557 /ORGANISM="Thalassiothrix antarctica, Strain L6-D1" /LENGTH=598 /DNA_ID=CAMNT_0038833745 /DNA_START=103 /DNA_END=1899 /DNA_ORIENTATION=+